MFKNGGVKGRLNNVKKKQTIWYGRASLTHIFLSARQAGIRSRGFHLDGKADDEGTDGRMLLLNVEINIESHSPSQGRVG